MEQLRGKNKAVFIDRDGTIIKERCYLSKIKDISFLSGAVKALHLLKSAGYKLILVTNQSGIARGYLTEKKLLRIHDYIQKYLKQKGVEFDAVYYCKHGPDDKCSCRKPRTGMVEQASKRYNIDLKRSFVIGDHLNDFLLGKNMGGRAVFVLTGHGKEEYAKLGAGKFRQKPDKVAKNILMGVKWILKQK